MGILKRIKDVTNRQLVKGTQVQFYPRGLSVPLDVFTDGKIRFGRKVNFPLGIVVPDNRFQIKVDGIRGVNAIEIDRDPEWIESGGYITIGERELHEVDDVVEGEGTFVLALNEDLLADHLEDTYVYHYSNPITVEGAYARGQDVIVIDSPWFIVRGDVIAIATSTVQVLSFREYTVTDLVYVSLINGIYQYQVTLDKPIHRSLMDGEVIQLRAYPAYKSRILSVPSQVGPRRQIVGPFLVDWMSGIFITKTVAEETQTLQRYTKSRTPIGPPLAIEKNHLILHVPIRADQFLFWDIVEGSVNYDNDIERFLMLPTDAGDWWLKYTCVPQIDVPFTYPGGVITTVEKALLINNEGFILDDSIDALRFEYQVTGAYVATPEAAATGTITLAAPPPFPVDNDYFTLDNGFGTSMTFEYKRTGSFTVSADANQVIDIQSAVNVTDIVIATVNAINAVSFLGILAVNASPSITLTNSVISQRGNQAIVLGPGLLGIGWLSVGMAGGTDEVETIDISGVTTDVEVAQLTSAAISRQRIKIRAEFPGTFPSFRLTSEIPGTAGNIPIVEFVANAGFIVQGMAGGSGGTKWNFQIKPDVDCLFRVRLYPNDFQDYNLLSGVTTTIVVDLAPDAEPIERIDLIVKTAGGGEIQMGNWNINGIRVGALQHDLVMRVIGEHNYGASTILAKQAFQSLDDLRLIKDINHRLDGGLLKL